MLHVGLTPDQEIARNVVDKGHNVVILGQAGTGKSFLIRNCSRSLEKLEKKVQITATTGIAVSQFTNGRTLHSWAGIADGRYGSVEVVDRVRADDVARQRLTSVDVLIVDEISMFSAKLFDQVEYLCRHIRGSDFFFGGIQVVCVGDFYQLPPTPNDLYRDPGMFAFESNAWKAGMKHKIILSSVLRQTDTDLILAINELETGRPSDFTTALLKSLDRPLPVDAKHNATAINNMEGDLQRYTSVDSGHCYLKRVQAKRTLSLKNGCPVILLKNVSTKLVNGSRGTVVDISKDTVTCNFDGHVIKLNRESFTVYDPDKRCIIAERLQFPISLAFALTVHKSQGLTLPVVEVHCANIHQPGQMGVAVGRAETRENLRVVGYSPRNCVRHKDAVNEFYDEPGAEFSEDLSCCTQIPVDNTAVGEPPICEFSDESDFGEAELQLVQELEEEYLAEDQDMPTVETGYDYFDSAATTSFLNGLKSFYSVTSEQQDLNSCLTKLQTDNKAKDFINNQYHQLLSFLPEQQHDTSCTIPVQNWSQFCSSYQGYLSSAAYTKACTGLFSPVPIHHLTCGHIMTALRKKAVQSLQTATKESKETVPKKQCISKSAYGKIRYVGGRCLAKIKHRHMNIVRRAIESGRHADETVSKRKNKVDILQSMTATQDAILQDSKYPESLHDTFRKQNLSCGLTNTNDETFEFFMSLEERRLPLYEQFQIHGENILSFVQDAILENQELFRMWSTAVAKSHVSSNYETQSKQYRSDAVEYVVQDTLHDLTDASICVEELFPQIVKSYLSVTDGEFRCRVLSEMGKKKGMEHRKKVLSKQSKKSDAGSTPLTWQSIDADTSAEKELSHLRLKCLVVENSEGLMKFTRKELVNIGNLYDLKLSGKKNTMVSALSDKIKSSPSMQKTIHNDGDQSTLAIPMASTSEDTVEPVTMVTETHEAAVSGTRTQQDTVKEPEASSGQTSTGKRSVKKTSRKRRGKGQKIRKTKTTVTEDADGDCCVKCGETEFADNEDPWIMCSFCQGWYHRTCGELFDQAAWDVYSQEEALWKCPVCKDD